MSTPLRELITSLSVDSTSRDAFAANPAGFLAEHGWADLDGEDVGTALGALADEAPIDQAVRLSELVNGTEFDGAIAGLGAAAEALAEVPVPPNGEADVLELADPELALDRHDEPDIDGIDDESDIDEIDDTDGGPDGPDRLDVSDDELDTSTFRALDDYEDDGEEAAEPAADAYADIDADAHDTGPDVSLSEPTGGIDQGAGHESFIATDDDGGDAVDVPEPEDDDL